MDLRYEPPTWDLIRRIQEGDREASGLLYERYGPRVTRLVRRALGRSLRARIETQDLVQSAFLEILEDIPRFAYRDEGSFLCWLTRIVENKIRAAARYWGAGARASRREEQVDVSGMPSDRASPSAVIRRDEEFDLLLDAVAGLPPRERRVVIERMLLELPWEVVAREHETSVPAVQILLSRAKKRLARRLEPLGG